MSITTPATVLEATESFVCEIDGQRYFIHAGTSRIAAEHVLAKTYPQHFRPLDGSNLSYEVEETTAEPGRRSRPVRPHREATPPPPPVSDLQEVKTKGETTGLTSASLRQGSKPKDKEN